MNIGIPNTAPSLTFCKACYCFPISSISILVSDDVHQLVYLLIGLSKFDVGVNWVGLGSAAAELKDDWISWL